MPRLRSLLHIRRHPLGPRVYVGGLRVHECWAGLIAVIAIAVSEAAHRPGPHPLDAAVGVVAVWMIAKDWPDFFPSRRDTYSWRLGLHRREPAPVPVRAEDDYPAGG